MEASFALVLAHIVLLIVERLDGRAIGMMRRVPARRL